MGEVKEQQEGPWSNLKVRSPFPGLQLTFSVESIRVAARQIERPDF